MPSDNEQRNGGRTLAVVIESGDVRDRSGLADLSEVTRRTVEAWGYDTNAWPRDVRTFLDGTEHCKARFVEADQFGEWHVFAFVDLGAMDLWIGVSSRREQNVPGVKSGNLATNLLLDVLNTRDPRRPDRPLYGTVLVENLARLWRHELVAAYVQHHAKEWHLVLRSPAQTLDYSQSGTSLIGAIRGSQDADSATDLVRHAAKHKQSAHENGQLKYARGQTHPAIKIDFRTREMSYDFAVVEAIRKAASLRIAGASWHEVAAEVGHLIPATQASQEADLVAGTMDTRARSIETRNSSRRLRGRKPLPFQYLEDGTPNPEYRTLTIADLHDPASRMRSLFMRGVTIPAKDRECILNAIDDDLGGIDPRDTNLAFYGDGIYRRLVKDQTRSNASRARYRWAEFDLGKVDDGYLLSAEQVKALRNLRTGKRGTGSWGYNPLAQVFNAQFDHSIYSSGGWLRPEDGELVVRSYSDHGKRGLRIWFEPWGSTPHGSGCRIVGRVTEDSFYSALADLLLTSCSDRIDLARFVPPQKVATEDSCASLQTELAVLDSQHTRLTEQLADPSTPSRARTKLLDKLSELEDELTVGEERLKSLQSAEPTSMRTSAKFDISTFADLIAILRLREKLPARVADRCSRLFRALLPDATLILEPSSGMIRVSATLSLRSSDGQLYIPCATEVANEAADPWIASLAGLWWEGGIPLEQGVEKRGLKTKTVTRWADRVVDRLLEVAAENEMPEMNAHAAAFLTRAPHSEVIRTTISVVSGEMADNVPLASAIRALLFESNDLPNAAPWSSGHGSRLERLVRNSDGL